MDLTRSAVRDLLRTVGPMTSTELATFFPDSTRWDVSSVISSMRYAARRQVRVHGWVREVEKQKCYLRAVYALGAGRDALKPVPLTNAERMRRYRSRQALGRGVPTSVWDWAARMAA